MACVLMGMGGLAFPAFLLPTVAYWDAWIRFCFVWLLLLGIGGIGYARYRQGHKAQAAQVGMFVGIVLLLAGLLYVWVCLLLAASG